MWFDVCERTYRVGAHGHVHTVCVLDPQTSVVVGLDVAALCVAAVWGEIGVCMVVGWGLGWRVGTGGILAKRHRTTR